MNIDALPATCRTHPKGKGLSGLLALSEDAWRTEEQQNQGLNSQLRKHRTQWSSSMLHCMEGGANTHNSWTDEGRETGHEEAHAQSQVLSTGCCWCRHKTIHSPLSNIFFSSQLLCFFSPLLIFLMTPIQPYFRLQFCPLLFYMVLLCPLEVTLLSCSLPASWSWLLFKKNLWLIWLKRWLIFGKQSQRYSNWVPVKI